MKQIAILFLVLFCSGCTMMNIWVIKGDGKDLKGAYQVANAEASRIDAVFTRTLLLTTQKVNKEFLESLPKVKVTVDNDNKTKSIIIGKE